MNDQLTLAQVARAIDKPLAWVQDHADQGFGVTRNLATNQCTVARSDLAGWRDLAAREKYRERVERDAAQQNALRDRYTQHPERHPDPQEIRMTIIDPDRRMADDREIARLTAHEPTTENMATAEVIHQRLKLEDAVAALHTERAHVDGHRMMYADNLLGQEQRDKDTITRTKRLNEIDAEITRATNALTTYNQQHAA